MTAAATTSRAAELAGPDWVQHLRPNDVDDVRAALAHMTTEIRDVLALIESVDTDPRADVLIEDVITLGNRVIRAGQHAAAHSRRVRTRAILVGRRVEYTKTEGCL